MNELSIEEKAKRYDEAIKRVENIKTGKYKTTFMFTEGLFEHIFPELKESEDERIRKEIINYIKNSTCQVGDKTYNSWIAWLEKQGEHANFINKIQIGDKVTRNEDGVLVNLSRLNRVAKKDEKQGVPKEHDVCDNCEQQGSCVSLCPMKLVEKQGEQKIPKFKVEDWVVTDFNNVVQIKVVDDSGYVLENRMRFSINYVDKCWHKWTIQDAKDGDVLACADNIIIYGGYINNYGDRIGNKAILAYCGWNGKKLVINKKKKEGFGGIGYIPATKEQRDLLFQKMHEAGYEWDAEHKQLKKIEQKPTWKPSEGQMELLREVQQALLGKDCHNRFVNFVYELKRLREE